MPDYIKTLTIEGFKSIRRLDQFPLGAMNVLIGANGAGKSNFISFFRFLRDIVDERLQVAVQRGGGADPFLYLGPKVTNRIVVEARFGNEGYDFSLIPTVDGRLIFEQEQTLFIADPGTVRRTIGSGNQEANLPKLRDDHGLIAEQGGFLNAYQSVSSWIVYHFHDTSENSAVRRLGVISDDETLRSDGSNLAAFLYRLRKSHPQIYDRIVTMTRLAAPFFGDFRLRPHPTMQSRIELEWTQRGSDLPFSPSQLSDGTLRFICLATALLQPVLPSTMLFDEPELGLHPYALVLLSRLLRTATQPAGFVSNQVIVSTQSAQLLNEFNPDEVIVVERADGQSTFTRLNPDQLSLWLEEYSLGELWQKNLLGGRPRSETVLSSSVGAV